jgi:hypothetical protein
MDQVTLWSLAIGGGICYGYFHGYGYVKNKVKSYMASYVLEEVKKACDQTQNEEGITFESLEPCKAAVIHYRYGGQQYKMLVPYDKSKARQMARKEVILIKQDNNDLRYINITQKQGIPYLLSASQMGGIKIKVTKDDEEIKTYGPDEIPGFL